MPTWEELEKKAFDEYNRLVHTVVRVSGLSGYVDNDSYDFICPEGRTVVRVCSTGENEICRRIGDGWLDPIFEVEIVETGILREAYGQVPNDMEPRSCWVHGTSRNLDGREEPGEIIMDAPESEEDK